MISTIVSTLKQQWSRPRAIPVDADGVSFEHCCTFAEPVDLEHLEAHLDTTNFPNEILEFWQVCNGAVLFLEVNFAQWGLEILPCEDVNPSTLKFRADRPTVYRDGDVIIGRFIGDSELLLMRADPQQSDFGQLIVVGPIDPRHLWRTAADDFRTFLIRYAENEGEKYWEKHPDA